jgi:hypothetical protein
MGEDTGIFADSPAGHKNENVAIELVCGETILSYLADWQHIV